MSTNRTRVTLLALLALWLATACASVSTGHSSAASDESAIRDSRIAQNRAIAAGDIASVERFWTEDVTVRRALGTPMAGRAEVRKAFELTGPRDSSVVYQRATTGLDISRTWPLAFETGTWTGRLGSERGPIVISGKFSAQWVKREGRWLIRSEVFVPLACSGVGCSYKSLP